MKADVRTGTAVVERRVRRRALKWRRSREADGGGHLVEEQWRRSVVFLEPMLKGIHEIKASIARIVGEELSATAVVEFPVNESSELIKSERPIKF